MHPDVKTLQWIQCDRCNKWLHSDCAAIDPAMVTKDMPSTVDVTLISHILMISVYFKFEKKNFCYYITNTFNICITLQLFLQNTINIEAGIGGGHCNDRSGHYGNKTYI